MTAYRNFTSDFPSRCLEVIDSLSPEKYKKRHVTALLMAASAAFVVPFERLRLDAGNSTLAPPNKGAHASEVAILQALMAEEFVGSILCPNELNSWRFAKKVRKLGDTPDEWLPNIGLHEISVEKKSSSVLSHIRNALAHANIETKGDPIEKLVFVTERKVQKQEQWIFDSYEVLVVSPADFETFLRAWVGFVNGREMWDFLLAA